MYVAALDYQPSYSPSANELGIIRVRHNYENALTFRG
jgi:hypothetical protein